MIWLLEVSVEKKRKIVCGRRSWDWGKAEKDKMDTGKRGYSSQKPNQANEECNEEEDIKTAQSGLIRSDYQ